jgi:hypothetical protein
LEKSKLGLNFNEEVSMLLSKKNNINKSTISRQNSTNEFLGGNRTMFDQNLDDLSGMDKSGIFQTKEPTKNKRDLLPSHKYQKHKNKSAVRSSSDLDLNGLKSMEPNYNDHNQKLYWHKNVHAFAG